MTHSFRLFFLLLLLCSAAGIRAQKLPHKTYTASAFRYVYINCRHFCEIYRDQAASPKAEITAPANILKHIHLRSSGDSLWITDSDAVSKASSAARQTVYIYLAGADIRQIENRQQGRFHNGRPDVPATAEDPEMEELGGETLDPQTAANRKPEVVSTKNFTAITTHCTGSVFFRQGKRCEVRLEGSEAEKARIQVTVAEGTVTISDKEEAREAYVQSTLAIYITAPSLKAITCNGTGDFVAESPVTFKDIVVEKNSVGNVIMRHVSCNNLQINMKGTGNMEINIEKASNVKADINSIGDLMCDAKAETIQVFTENKGVTRLTTQCRQLNLTLGDTGIGEVDITTDCTYLNILNNRTVSDMTIRGTADNVVIKGNGISTINTEDLNRLE